MRCVAIPSCLGYALIKWESFKYTAMVQKRNPVDTRDRILKVAIQEFSAKGLDGARIEVIARKSKANTRMIYHYFGGKEQLYIASLEYVLDELRIEELKQDVKDVRPLDGLLHLFDFIQSHFAAHPELISLMSSENILKARYLKKSGNIHERSSSLLKMIGELLERGMQSGELRPGLDPLRLYVAMVSLSYFHRSNAYTLSALFQADLLSDAWRTSYQAQARELFVSFLQAPPAQA